MPTKHMKSFAIPHAPKLIRRGLATGAACGAILGAGTVVASAADVPGADVPAAPKAGVFDADVSMKRAHLQLRTDEGLEVLKTVADARASIGEGKREAKREQRKQRRERRAAREAAKTPSPESVGVSTATLESIAACESGGNPAAISSTGAYRGKYQFSYSTWASVGGSGDPAAAPVAEQDYRAALLYSRAGSSPWPVCG